MAASRDAVIAALMTVADPASGNDIMESGVVRALNVDETTFKTQSLCATCAHCRASHFNHVVLAQHQGVGM